MTHPALALAKEALEAMEAQLKHGPKTKGFARPVRDGEDILWKTLTVDMPRPLRKQFLEALPTIKAALSACAGEDENKKTDDELRDDYFNECHPGDSESIP